MLSAAAEGPYAHSEPDQCHPAPVSCCHHEGDDDAGLQRPYPAATQFELARWLFRARAGQHLPWWKEGSSWQNRHFAKGSVSVALAVPHTLHTRGGADELVCCDPAAASDACCVSTTADELVCCDPAAASGACCVSTTADELIFTGKG